MSKNTITLSGNQNNKKIHEGMELGRVLAAIAVIYIHFSNYVLPFIHASVPFFFTLSGYFLAKNSGSCHAFLETAKRFAIKHFRLLLIWALVYTLLPANWPSALLHGQLTSSILNSTRISLAKLIANPINWMLDGPPNGFHLWYLANAPLPLAFIALCFKPRLKWLPAIAAIVALALLSTLTETSCIGSVVWATKAKLGILIATPCLIAGWYYRFYPIKKSGFLLGTALIVTSLIADTLQATQANVCPTIQSITFGVGAFLVLAPFQTVWLGSVWAILGKLTLYVYIIHIAIRPVYYMIAYKLPQIPGNLTILAFTLIIFLTAYLFNNLIHSPRNRSWVDKAKDFFS